MAVGIGVAVGVGVAVGSGVDVAVGVGVGAAHAATSIARMRLTNKSGRCMQGIKAATSLTRNADLYTF